MDEREREINEVLYCLEARERGGGERKKVREKRGAVLLRGQRRDLPL